MDVGWMLPTSAFEWFEDHLLFGSTILEFGSGWIVFAGAC